jgi:hypothetical protein
MRAATQLRKTKSWRHIDEGGRSALNYLFGKRKQEQQKSPAGRYLFSRFMAGPPKVRA